MTAPRKKSTKKPASSARKAASRPRSKPARAARSDDEEADPLAVPTRPGTPTRPDRMDREVVAFITAIEEYKRLHQRPFPTWSEILEVVKALGYVRQG